MTRYRLTLDVPTPEDVVEVLKLLEQKGFTGDLTVNLTPEILAQVPGPIQKAPRERLWGTFVGERSLRECYVLRAVQKHPEGIRPSQISEAAGRSRPWALNVLHNIAQNLGFYEFKREEIFRRGYRQGYTIITPGPLLLAHPLPEITLPVRKVTLTPTLAPRNDNDPHLPRHPDP